MNSYDVEDIQPGDIVAVRYGLGQRQEGLVVDSRIDYSGRQRIVVQLDGEVRAIDPWVYRVTRVKRLVSHPYSLPKQPRTIERRIYW